MSDRVAPRRDPSGRTELDPFAVGYEQKVRNAVPFVGGRLDLFTSGKAEWLLDLTREQFEGNSKLDVLDLGCGIGLMHELIQPHFSTLHGVDISLHSIFQASSSNLGSTYSAFDGLRLPFGPGSFDVVVMISVLHHAVPDQREGLLSAIHEVLRPGGQVVVFEHNPLSLVARWAVARCPFDEDAVLVRRGEAESLIRNTNFGRVRSGFLLFTPFRSQLFRWLDRRLVRVPLGAQYWTTGVRG